MQNKNEWKKYNFKYMRTDKNRELVTLRATCRTPTSVRVVVSIGLIICDLINFKNADRIIFKTHPIKKNIILIKKDDGLNGYKLSGNGKHKVNFLTFSFTSNYYHDYRLSQTTIADYDIINNDSLLVDFSKLKWRK